ncbi:TetR/AcrR family transcriptional regulator [Mycobacterium vicinigordonae]|uniref:TetR/AcrR family transcriptional regulator n=1 Tax=Mycobacterium vicinigordonae TaxID=1719132 RepID=A0A7D6E2H5_9MYCO|nr:TetR/AcrR family transcriptional regulator [Mycobacterium vicinigordonae]QLL07266.1 TetR/AcrR family transcriptional regulator [Mycobacterium vicinigordonae]
MPYVESAVRSKQAVAAARAVLIRDGVGGLTMRAVATEANIPLGTLQYVFPTKQGLLRAVFEDIVAEIAELLRNSAELEAGLARAIRVGLRSFWAELVVNHRDLQLVQLELVTHALRTPGLEELPRWQYEQYTEIVAHWCETAAAKAGETSAIPFDRLARVLVAGIDGLILQHVISSDTERALADLDVLADTVIALATVRAQD